MELEDHNESDEKDILDSSVFGPNVKLFSCVICDQKFTNKVKITLHWAVNHAYKLCGFCSNYAFLYDSDKIQHERQHLPFGCSTCDHEFTIANCHEIISEHYKKAHQSFLCLYCSSVIDPYSKYPEHVEKKHNFINYSEYVGNGELCEVIGDPDNGFFHCKMCDKKKRIEMLYGHYIFYHNFSIHALRNFLEKCPSIRINGSTLPDADNDTSEGGSCSDKDVCNVCEKPMNPDSNIHEVFCQGFVICSQKECDKLFENKKDLVRHLDEHPVSSCKFGCREINLKAREVDEHLQKSHDIVECNLCYIMSGSGSIKNHLRDKHSVNLMTYEKALTQTSSKLYRVDRSSSKSQVLCNFCDYDLTQQIKEFSFIDHYQNEHQIDITAIVRNLDKNPIINVVLSDKKHKTDEECLKNFTVVVQNLTDEFVEVDFDTSKVYCIGLDTHIEQKPLMNSDDESKISCEFCNESTFDASCRLYEHMNVSHGFRLLNVNDQCDTCHVETPKKSPDPDKDDKSFNLSLMCPFDETSFVTKENFKNHMAFEHDQKLMVDKILYKCFECNYAYNKIDEVRNHFMSAHPDNQMSYCRICRSRLTTPNENNLHFNLNHAEVEIKQVQMFCCNLCKKTYKAKSKAKMHFESQHKKVEAKKPGFKCQFKLCREAFDNKEDRRMHHMIAHPDEKMFTCKTCPLQFSTKSSLSSHKQVHNNVLNTCEHCKKTFIRRDSFKEHLLIHSGVRQKCSFCDKTFVQRSNLVRHERIHLNDKPYKCNYCDKTFSDKGACNSHEKVHTKSEHSNCEVCGKHFARKQKLKYHMRIHTLENVLTCDCGKIFTESYSFRKHKETHLKKGRSDKCEECGKIFKSAKAKAKHIMEYHTTFPEPESLVETKIQCTLCNLKNFSLTNIKDHLNKVHKIEDTNDWESYIEEVEFEMDISEGTSAT